MRPAVAICAFLILAVPLLGIPGGDVSPERDADIEIIPDSGAEASAAPTAVLLARPDEADVDEEIFLDATESAAGSGDKMWFRFHAGDGTPATQWMTVGIWSHSYDKKGTFRARVEVKNENEEISEASVRIEVGKDDDSLLFGLSAMALILVVVIAALVLGLLALLLRRRRKAANEPYYDPYAARFAGGTGTDHFKDDDYPGEDVFAPDHDHGDDHPVEEVPEGRPTGEVPEATPGRPPAKRKVKRPVTKKVKRPVRGPRTPPPAAEKMKTLMVNCPNCDNNMEIKYVGPPVFLTCDKCGMKGEIPEEMLD